jgi:hypothetical protein
LEFGVSGERLPAPDWQVRMALEVAREQGIPFGVAWTYAVNGQICDAYRSARGTGQRADYAAPCNSSGPPNLRGSAGQKRCAGCRFIQDAADGGQARCALFDVNVFAGVLWPHRTDDRRQWQAAIRTSIGEWRRCYADEPSRVGAILDAIRLRGQELALGGGEGDDGRHAAA